jgi:PAS domain S-box-containing protein
LNHPTSQALRVVALGDFAGEIPPLAPRLAALNVAPLRSASLDRLPATLDDHDVLVTELNWLNGLAPAQREDLSRRARKTAGWIALTDGEARFKEQVTWQRIGVKHFFRKPLIPERLAALLEDIHDRLDGPPIRVILLDDEESALSYYGTTLKQAGFVVAATQDPLIVIEAIEEFRPDLLLVDIEMPGCRGPELVTIVRQRPEYAQLPAIFLTAMEGMNDLLLARQAAAEDFLPKPVAPELLIAAVQSQAWRHRARLRNDAQHQQQEARARYRLEQLQLALDKHAIVSTADASGNIVYVNEKFCELSGYTRQELLGQNHRIVKSGEHRPEFYDELWQTITSGRIWHGEVCNRSKDGRPYWVEATIVPFLDGKGTPTQFISIRTDITRLKKNEAALHILVSSTVATVGDEFLRASAAGLAKSMGVRIGFIAERDGDDETRIRTLALWDTDHVADNFSYSAQHTPCEHVLRDGYALYPAKVADMFPQDSWLRENGIESYVGIVLCDAHGGFLGHLGIMDDKPLLDTEENVALLKIFAARVAAELERMRAERELERSKERLQRGQAYANIGTWDWNVQTGELYWSERIAPLFGYRDGELETSYENFIKVLHPDDRQAVIDAVNATVEHDAPYDIEHRVIWPDGTERWLLERGAVARDAAGKPRHMLGVVQDIDVRKRAELALADSERHLREAHALARIGHWEADMVGGEVRWSEETYRIFGRAPADFTPSLDSFHAAVHPDDLDMLRESERATAASGSYDNVHRIVRPDGTVRYVHDLGRAERDASGRIVRLTGTVQDITERRSIELALAERERLLSAILKTTHQGFWFIDTEGRTTEVNPAMCTILDRPREEILGRNIMDFVDARNAEIFRRQLEQRRQGLANPYEIALCRPDGTLAACINTPTPLHDQHGNRIGSVGLFTDITEIKQTGDRLALFRRIFDASNQCIGIADGQGRLFYQNLAHAQTVGYSDEEIAGHPFSMFLPADMAESLTTQVYAALAEGRNWAGHLPIRRKDGSIFTSVSNIGFVKDEEGQIQYIFNIYSDFSEELERRNELALAKESAERANQAKSDFLSSMSHELRTPMNAIIGFAQMLEYDESLTGDQLDNVQEILKGGRHLLELINEVLDLAKIESGRIDLSIEAVDLTNLIEDCRQLIQPLATQRGIAMALAAMPGAAARADRVRLKQVLLNLLSNAVKYNREGGDIRLDVRPAAGARLRIEVADTGTGIPPERIEEIFQPFNRLDAEYSEIEGTGIGLTITLRLVEMMGGTVGVDSEVGKGSTFWIDLPQETRGVPTETMSSPTAQPGNAPADHQHLVLSIDDNPVNLKLIAQILALRRHIKLITAHTPELGIELALAHRPDLILLDINMPGMDGYQVLEVFKADARLKDIPVVAVTANAMPRDIERGMQSGFADYLTKPLVIDRFLQVVDAQLAVRPSQ